MSKIYNVEVTEEHLKIMADFIEATHRAVCGQYSTFFDIIKNYTNFTLKDKYALESFLQSQTYPELEPNSSYSGTYEALGYQTYRDILEFFAKKDNSNNVYSCSMSQISDQPKLKITEKDD